MTKMFILIQDKLDACHNMYKSYLPVFESLSTWSAVILFSSNGASLSGPSNIKCLKTPQKHIMKWIANVCLFITLFIKFAHTYLWFADSLHWSTSSWDSTIELVFPKRNVAPEKQIMYHNHNINKQHVSI